MRIKITSILLIILMLSSISYASTNTETRTPNDLKIKDSIVVTNTVINAALKTPKVDETEKVYDFANLLNDAEEMQLYNQIQDYIEYSNYDMAVVTIDQNNKRTAMEYADDFYDYNYFGYDQEYSGILFLIDMDTREMYISTTGKAIARYNDNEIDKILDQTYAKISQKDYYGCVEKFIQYAKKYYDSGDSVVVEGKFSPDEDPLANNISNNPIMYIGIFSCILPTILVITGCVKHRTVKKAFSGKAYLVNNSVQLTNQEDIFIRSSVSKVARDHDSGGSSGGGGGHSSSHHSSSGSSHGGGGRRF